MVGACAPAGTTNMEAAARLMLELGGKTKVYMINKAAYSSEADMRAAAKAAVGQAGSGGALGLKVITAGKADQAAIDKLAQSLTAAVSLFLSLTHSHRRTWGGGGERIRVTYNVAYNTFTYAYECTYMNLNTFTYAYEYTCKHTIRVHMHE